MAKKNKSICKINSLFQTAKPFVIFCSITIFLPQICTYRTLDLVSHTRSLYKQYLMIVINLRRRRCPRTALNVISVILNAYFIVTTESEIVRVFTTKILMFFSFLFFERYLIWNLFRLIECLITGFLQLFCQLFLVVFSCIDAVKDFVAG